MYILGIDTSCDDTSVAITDGTRILANSISSQDQIHREWGGVVPILAKREHEAQFARVLEIALKRAGLTLKSIDLIAVTEGPGLAPALEVGVRKAAELAQQYTIPVVPINHMEGHLFSSCASSRNGKGGFVPQPADFPLLGILVSGGHTEFVLVDGIGQYRIVGQTVDDALGEAYDKIARLLNLGYPGGSLLAQLANEGNPQAYPLPIAMRQSGDLNVSYSGLKTATVKLVKQLTDDGKKILTRQEITDVAASFQRAALETLLNKLRQAVKLYQPKHLLLGGGVAANAVLRQELRALAKTANAQLHVPYTLKLCRDNAAMIATAASLRQQFGVLQTVEPEKLDRRPRWSL